MNSLDIHFSKVPLSLFSPVFLLAALVLVTLLLASPLRKEDSRALELSLLSSELFEAEDDEEVPKESSISLSKKNKASTVHYIYSPIFTHEQLFCNNRLKADS